MLINQCTKYIYLKREKSIKRSFEKGILCAANLKNANKQYNRMQRTIPSAQHTKKQKKELGRIEAFKEMTNITVPEMAEAQAYLDEDYQQQWCDQLYLEMKKKKKTNKILQLYAYLELSIETV